MFGIIKCSILALMVVLVFSCEQVIKGRQGDSVVSVDLEHLDSPSFYDYFSKIEIYPLETSDKSLMKFPHDYRWNNDELYILDPNLKSLFIFDKQGKFIRELNKYGNGPGEYLDLSDCQFNRFTGDMELLSPMLGIFIYDNKGEKFKKRLNLPPTVLAAHNFISISPGVYLFFCAARDGNKIVTYDYNKNEIVAELYDLPRFLLLKTLYHHSYTPFYVFEDKVHFVQGYNGDVFTYENGQLIPKYQWDFGKHNFDLSDLEDNSIAYFLRHSRTVGTNWATTFISYVENSNYYMTGFKFNHKNCCLICNKNDKTHMVFSSFKEGHLCIPMSIDETGIYYFSFAREIAIIVNREELDEANRKRYDSIQSDDNPLIIKYVFK